MIELTVIEPAPDRTPPPKGWKRRLGSLAPRFYRLAVLVAIVWIIHRQETLLRIEGDDPIRLPEARAFFPAAARLDPDASQRLGFWVLNGAGQRIGYVLRTSPMSDKIVGYAGPTDTLVALTPDKTDPKVVGIRIRSSADTKEHVADVANDENFMGTWTGKRWDEVAGMDPRAAGMEGVSGASLTSLCIANGIHRRFQQSDAAAAAERREAHRLPHFRLADLGLIAAIAGACALTFTRLRSRPWLRRGFQAVVIGYVGFVNGQLIAQSLLVGWAGSTVPWRDAPGLTLLVAAALVIPWATRRQIYCSRLCPHGAAQEWVGRLRRRRKAIHLPRGLERGLRWLGPALIGLTLVVAMLHLPFNLAGIEPFDAYLVPAAGVATIGLATIGVAVAGLIAAAFVPMAYCKYGCPTGALLGFIRSHGKADAFGRRDLAAAALLLLAAALFTWHHPIHRWLIGA